MRLSVGIRERLRAAYRLASAGALALALGCQSPAEPDPGLRVATRGTPFERAPDSGEAIIPFVAENTADVHLYVPRCGSRAMAALDRRDGGRWVQYSGDVCPGIYTTDLRPLPAGGRLEGQRVIAEPGRYRLRIGASRTADGDWVETVSNAFVVR